MTNEQMQQVKATVDEMIKTKKVCCLCGGTQHQIDTFMTVNTKRIGQNVWIMPLCQKCADDPTLPTIKVSLDFEEIS
jgi:hypothetical protein